MAAKPKLEIPPPLRRGAEKTDEWVYIDSGRDLLAYVCEILGLENLGGVRMLDMGCGTKFTQAILHYAIPIGEYVGVDVYRKMIDFLAESTAQDPRFAFHTIDTHNAMYNTEGEKLGPDTRLPLEEHSFDLITLFSVFTHLAPEDYGHMLRLMRRYAKPDARLVYSLYLDEQSPGGHGLIDGIAEREGIAQWRPSGKPFLDAYPGKPLQWAIYSRDHALELIEGTGWKVEQVCMPNPLVQHHFICRPT